MVVGLNKYISEEESPIELLKINEKVQDEQIRSLHKVKRKRDNSKVTQTLNELRLACRSNKNVMPYVIEAVRAYATEQEVCDIYREVYGEYRDTGIL